MRAYADYNGSWCDKPDLSHLDRYYATNLDADGFVDLSCDVATQVDMSMDMELFARWLSNPIFEMSGLLRR